MKEPQHNVQYSRWDLPPPCAQISNQCLMFDVLIITECLSSFLLWQTDSKVAAVASNPQVFIACGTWAGPGTCFSQT